MTETAPKRRRRLAAHGPLVPDDGHTLGEEALHFARWSMMSKYRLMGEFVGELERAPHERDLVALRARYCRALEHAERVHRARGVVTFLLAIGVLAAATSAVANLMDAPDALATDVAATTALLERLAAWSTSLSVVFVATRLLMDRYLERVDVAATFLAIQLAGARR